MLCKKIFSLCLNICKPSLHCVAAFSSSAQCSYNKKDYRKKWITPEEWPKVESGDENLPWLPSLPRRHHPDNWTKEKAYFGMYDYLGILGNDVTIDPKLFCRGPGYVQAFNAIELRRLIRKRRRLGMRMHAEDLHTITKRINYLYMLENHKKKHTHG